MKKISELTSRERSIEVLRWLCVLPAAVLGDIAAQFVVGVVVQIARYGGWGIFGDSTIAHYLGMFLFYAPPKSAFVIVGAKLAPRHHSATTIVLILLGVLFSLLTHVIGQNLAGNRIGLVNCMHLFAECAGVLAGAAYILLPVWRNRPIKMAA